MSLPLCSFNFQEFEMDPEIKKELNRQTQSKIEIVEKEMAWEAEKHNIALEKLRHRSAPFLPKL